MNSDDRQPPLVLSPHQPVLLAEVVHWLPLPPSAVWVDGTLGFGGHTATVARQLGPDGLLIGIDQDAEALAFAQQRLEADPALSCSKRFIHANFDVLPQVLADQGIATITGALLLDLGVSSFQLDQAKRGFSFQQDGPLDMRMNATDPQQPTAAEWVNTASEAQLADCLHRYGEERLARPIARAIVRAREAEPFASTRPLAQVVAATVRRLQPNRKEPIHPATRTFQALRIVVNDELGALQRLLAELPQVLAPGARVGIISFHSLEDRLVKQAFRRLSGQCQCPPDFPVCQCGATAVLKPMTGRPVTATRSECLQNPRARSAKLRVAVRV